MQNRRATSIARRCNHPSERVRRSRPLPALERKAATGTLVCPCHPHASQWSSPPRRTGNGRAEHAGRQRKPRRAAHLPRPGKRRVRRRAATSSPRHPLPPAAAPTRARSHQLRALASRCQQRGSRAAPAAVAWTCRSRTIRSGSAFAETFACSS